ncbi:hypothetical protein MAR_017757, partial [Mya arenaria]
HCLHKHIPTHPEISGRRRGIIPRAPKPIGTTTHQLAPQYNYQLAPQHINWHNNTSTGTTTYQLAQQHINWHNNTSTGTTTHQLAPQHINWHHNISTGTTTHQLAQQHINWHNNKSTGTTTYQLAQQHINWHNNTSTGTTTHQLAQQHINWHHNISTGTTTHQLAQQHINWHNNTSTGTTTHQLRGKYVVSTVKQEKIPVINGAPKFSAGLGYQLKIKQLEEENRYLVTAIADVADGDSVALQKCKSYSYYLNNDADDGTTVLNNVNETTTRYAVFWSSDVDHYTLMLRCFIKEGLPEPRTCKVEDTAISLFVPDTLDNLKWSKVLKDLEETDVEFGNERFEWFFNFNYGKSTCVDV